MNVKSVIRMMSTDISVNETSRNMLCPYCEGGQSGEHTFSITRTDMGLLYNCYRASCEKKGFVSTSPMDLDDSKSKQKKSKIRPYTKPLYECTAEDDEYFFERFGIHNTFDKVKITDSDEYALPILNPLGHARGIAIRQPWSGSPVGSRRGVLGKKKAIVYPETEGPLQSFYLAQTSYHVCDPLTEESRQALLEPGTIRYVSPQEFQSEILQVRNDTLVIVEDQISAMKVAEQGVNAVALLGTHATYEMVQEWQSLNPKEVIIALDNDATQNAFKMARKWALAFDKVRVAMLECDLKDMPSSDVLTVLGLTS